MFAGTLITSSFAQDVKNHNGSKIPISITLFTESVSIPNVRSLFSSNYGIKIGTEWDYKNTGGYQLLQNLQVGYYFHKDLHSALFISSSLGYRKNFDRFFGDAMIGAGYLLIHPAFPMYENSNAGLAKGPKNVHKIMPSIGLGAGYHFEGYSVFTRYELFGEAPFGFKGIPVVPHQTFNIGTIIYVKSE